MAAGRWRREVEVDFALLRMESKAVGDRRPVRPQGAGAEAEAEWWYSGVGSPEPGASWPAGAGRGD
jgi:hypothetical protein